MLGVNGAASCLSMRYIHNALIAMCQGMPSGVHASKVSALSREKWRYFVIYQKSMRMPFAVKETGSGNRGSTS
eukprot:6210945-Pleurochrysis_carterae.AAC.1